MRAVLVSDLSADVLADLGLEAGRILPSGEWFVRPDATRPEAARLQRETPVTGAFESFVVRDPTLNTVVATTSIHFNDVPSIVECPTPNGRILVCAIAPDRLATAPEIGRYLHRLAASGSRSGDGTTSVAPKTIGVGIVGYGPFGGMGYAHGLAATETDGLAFVGVCDSNEERRLAAVADFPTVQGHADLAALCGADDVDVVIVATPPVLHAAIALELLRAGKHVVVEKPMCLTVAHADELLAVSAEVGRTITVHQNRRWDGDFLALRRAVDTGLLGDVFNMETFVGSFEHPCRWWHSDEAFSGGAVYDWGSHHIDWILRIFQSRPQRVRAISHKRVWRDVTNADQIDVHMRWDDGREARFIQSDVAGIRKPKFYVQGTSGTAAADYDPVTIDRLEDGRGHIAHQWHHAEVAADLRLSRYEPGYGTVEMVLPPLPRLAWPFHRALADHLILGEPIPVPPEESRDVVAVLEAAHTSGADGGVELDCG